MQQRDQRVKLKCKHDRRKKRKTNLSLSRPQYRIPILLITLPSTDPAVDHTTELKPCQS